MAAPNRRLRIVHLSDLHAPAQLGEDHYGQQRVIEALLDDLGERREERAVDLIVFSGDLSYDGTPEGLERGREVLLDPMRLAYPDVPIVLTPGNHDVNLAKVDPVTHSGLKAVLTSREAVLDRLEDEEKAAAARAPLKAWDELAAAWEVGLHEQHLPPYGRAYRLDRNGVSLAIGSFDSAWRAKGGMEDKGQLIVGADYVRSFLEENEDADAVAVTFHHPLDWLARFDAAPLRVALEESRALVLSGHDHIPDPTLELTTRGSALYCRAPCQYTGPDYSNGYAILDLDFDRGQTIVQLRRWQPERDRFGTDSETATDGAQAFEWPVPATEVTPVYHQPDSIVLKPFSLLAKEQSVIDDGTETTADLMVSDYTVPFRFWLVPHTEVFDRSVDRTRRPSVADPLKEMSGKRALIVSGPKMSGVTTALLWLLELHYRQVGTHIPAYVKAGPKFSLGRIQEAISRTRASFQSAKGVDVNPPVILAIDDVEPVDSKALGRMIRLLRENEDLIVVLGCHGDAHETVSRALERHDIQPGRLYLGPFGRRETRQLAARIAGPESEETVKRVLQIVQRLRLPRNPLNLAALISVIARESKLTAVNESGLLESFVRMLLDETSTQDPEGLNMDYRRREHLLQEIARRAVETNSLRIPYLEMEQLVLDYFKRIGWRSGSGADLIESLIERKVLVKDAYGVGFRYPALLHLFAAKATFDDSSFANLVFSDLSTYAPIIRHVAGLRRNDRETLEHVAEEAMSVRKQVTAAVRAGQFNLIEDKHGWSKIRYLHDARKLVQQRPEPPTEKELDEIDHEGIVEPDDWIDLRPFREQTFPRAVDQLVAASSLAASVLQSSELVEDVELRVEVMREVIAGWTVMTVLFAMEEDMTSGLHELLAPLFAEIEDEGERVSKVEHFARLFVISLMSLSLFIEVGSVHHEIVLSTLLDDEGFMEETANALFATMLYAMLHFPGWPRRLTELYERHGSHPMVSEVVRRWTLEEYYAEDLPAADLKEVEDLLVEILTPEKTVDVSERAAHGSKVREELRAERTKHRWANKEMRDSDEEGIA